MNLKKFFYRDYFAHSIPDEHGGRRKVKLEKSEREGDREAISLHNEPIFSDANRRLVDFVLVNAAIEALDFKQQTGSPLPGWAEIHLTTQYPGLFTGSGYNHETGNLGELKLGFFFDHTTGLPILPGSSVKGVLRSAFPRFEKSEADPLKPDLAANKASELQKNKARFVAALFSLPKRGDQPDYEKVHRLELAIFEGVDYRATLEARAAAVARNQPGAEQLLCYRSMRLHDVFLDAYISKPGRDGKILGVDALTPHGDDPLKNPIPLPFLKVLPEVEFTFQFLLQDSEIDELTLVTGAQKCAVFEIILSTFGVGAKTNVGYGQFSDTRTNQQQIPGATSEIIDMPGEPKWKPLRKGEKVEGIVVDDPTTPPHNIALKLFAGDPEQEIIVHVRFPAGRPVGTRASVVEIMELKPKIKIEIRKW